jgi:hypothetical protein
MENIEKFLNEEITRIEEEITLFGKTTLITFSNRDLKPLAMNIARRYESTWSEANPDAFIREGVEIVGDKFYITIVGELNGKQFVVSKMIELG